MVAAGGDERGASERASDRFLEPQQHRHEGCSIRHGAAEARTRGAVATRASGSTTCRGDAAAGCGGGAKPEVFLMFVTVLSLGNVGVLLALVLLNIMSIFDLCASFGMHFLPCHGPHTTRERAQRHLELVPEDAPGPLGRLAAGA